MSAPPRPSARGWPARHVSQPLVAVLARRGRFLVAEPLFHRGFRTTVERRGPVAADDGDLVLVGTGKRGARVVRVLGSPNVARHVVEGLMLDRGLHRAYPRSATAEAEDAAGSPYGATDRVDLTSLPTFTVDPEEARDFDDAISARREDGGIRVWVHIADVTAYLRPGGALDREAYRRGTSVYVPGAVEPMLPGVLSGDACSLRPGEERLAVSVEMAMRGTEPVAVSFQRSLVRSDARLTYRQVDDVFHGRERAAAPWAEPLGAAREVAAALRERRDRRGALEVDSAEPSFHFDAEGNVVGVVHEEQTESHRLIEELMVLANEQVAGYLADRRIPTLYRIHERPDPPAVASLVDQLASLDVPTPPLPRHMSPQQAAELAAEASRLAAAESRRSGRGRQAFRTLVLRSLKQAAYSPRNLGHAGLASPRYCHFTSPIRRYPDVVAHRALLQGLGLDHAAHPGHELGEAGVLSSAAERDAMAIERDADDVCSTFLLERLLAEGDPASPGVFEGEVIGVIPRGAFVSFGAERFEGLLPVRRMPEWWELNEQETALIAHGSGRALRLGDPIEISVERVDPPRGRIDLLPAGSYS
jgi:ribonuclease R